MIGAVVLAAGAGTRLGGVAKALCTLDGETFLAAIARTARAAGAEPLVVVGPPHGEAVAAAARALGLAVVWNPAPARGMASSIACGFAALDAALPAALLWPVDHPRVAVDVITALIASLIAARGDADAAIPTFGDRGGHPALVGRALWPALCAGDHPDGARGVLRAARTVRVAVADPGVVRDVDTPAMLAELRASGAR